MSCFDHCTEIYSKSRFQNEEIQFGNMKSSLMMKLQHLNYAYSRNRYYLYIQLHRPLDWNHTIIYYISSIDVGRTNKLRWK